MFISIHALVKRATNHLLPPRRARAISIHALVKRATELIAGKLLRGRISIHALVKRATKHCTLLQDKHPFQSTPS